MEELNPGEHHQAEQEWQESPQDEDTINLDELAEWVEWLVKTYQLHSQIRPCWPLHPGAVQVLEALRLGRIAAENQKNFALITWHQALAGLVDMASQRMSACRSDRHEPEINQSWQSWVEEAESSHPTIKSPRPPED